MNSHQIIAEITRKELLAQDIVRLTLRAPQVATLAVPGQFIMVKVSDGISPLLRRPFSIHQTGSEEWLQILFKVVGKGTGILAKRQPGEELNIIGPLGHGFALPSPSCKHVCLVGGGMGIAPLLFLSSELMRRRPELMIRVYLGAARGGDVQALRDDFAAIGIEAAIATDDGSMGFAGFVTDLLGGTLERGHEWQFYSCGPHPMMRKVAEFCASANWPCQVSLESLMACGISACLGCTIRSSAAKSLSSNSPFLHVCKEGPVFNSGEVAWSR